MNSPTDCTCGRLARATCTNCGEPICAWHTALSPVLVETKRRSKVQLVPVCHPVCEARGAWARIAKENAA